MTTTTTKLPRDKAVLVHEHWFIPMDNGTRYWVCRANTPCGTTYSAETAEAVLADLERAVRRSRK